MNAYIERVIEQVKKRDAHEPEFIQTVEEVFASIEKEGTNAYIWNGAAYELFGGDEYRCKRLYPYILLCYRPEY